MSRVVIAGLAVALMSPIMPACGGGGDEPDGGTRRVDIDVIGCLGGVQALSLLVRVERQDVGVGFCSLEESCLDVSFSGASVEDIKATLRSQGFPLFDVPADEIDRITVALSATSGCQLGVLATGCGSAQITDSTTVASINLQCGTGQVPCGAVTGTCSE